MANDSDYQVRLKTLKALGGDVTKHYDSVYDIDLAILALTGQGGGGTTLIGGDGITITNGVIDFSEAFENWIESVENRIYEL